MTTTMRKTMTFAALATALTVAVGAGVPAEIEGQSLANRITRVHDGSVRLSFASRSDVCGNGRASIGTTSSRNGERLSRFRDEWEDECEPGPVRVAVDVADGRVVALRTYVGGRWRAGGSATDIGMVGVREATDYLLGDLVRAGGKLARDAIFPASLADSVTTWPRMLAIARDQDIERAVRTQAVFWVGQQAGERATQGLRDVADDSKIDRQVRLQAVFAISQHRDGGVPKLIDIAKGSGDREVKKQAIFWLGQSNDKRALDYFESILKR
jgi:uncharacterized low-complexity protein